MSALERTRPRVKLMQPDRYDVGAVTIPRSKFKSGSRSVEMFDVSLSSDDLVSAHRAVDEGVFSSEVGDLEDLLESFYDVDRALATNSATSALLLGLIALQCPGKVLLSDVAFPATINSVIRAGMEPVICQPDPDTLMFPNWIHDELASRRDIRVAMPLHLYGADARVAEMTQHLERLGGGTVGDAAHVALIPELISQTTLSALSYYPTKPIRSFDGGALLGSTLAIERARVVARHGAIFDWSSGSRGLAASYRVVEAGYKLLMNPVSAAVARTQYRNVETALTARREVLNWYIYSFDGLPVVPRAGNWSTISPGLYAIAVSCPSEQFARDVKTQLDMIGLPTGTVYPLLSDQVVSRSFEYIGDREIGRTESGRTLLFPIHGLVTEVQVHQYAETIRAVDRPKTPWRH